jgi:hypothetical protein
MNTRGDGVRVAYPLFNQVGGGGANPTSPLQLTLDRIDFETARELNKLWHSRLPLIRNPASVMRQYPCFGAEFGGIWYATAIWSNPVARLLPQTTWLELRRLAIAPDAPKNTSSRMLAVMARLIRRDFPHVVRLVSYQDMNVHTGCIYRAAGWVLNDQISKRFRTWTNHTRTRNAEQSDAPKQRWEKEIRP